MIGHILYIFEIKKGGFFMTKIHNGWWLVIKMILKQIFTWSSGLISLRLWFLNFLVSFVILRIILQRWWFGRVLSLPFVRQLSFCRRDGKLSENVLNLGVLLWIITKSIMWLNWIKIMPFKMLKKNEKGSFDFLFEKSKFTFVANRQFARLRWVSKCTKQNSYEWVWQIIICKILSL